MFGKKTKKMMDTLYGEEWAKFFPGGSIYMGRIECNGIVYKTKKLEEKIDKLEALLNEIIDDYYGE